MDDNFKIKLGDVALNFKGGRMLVVERDGRPWHFTHPFEELRDGDDRGLLRPHVSRRKGKKKLRKAFDRFTAQLIKVASRGAWPRTIKYSIEQLQTAMNGIGEDLARLHWSRLERVDRSWVEQHAVFLTLPDTDAIEGYVDKAIEQRRIELTEADAEALGRMGARSILEPEEGLERIEELFAAGKTDFLLAGIYLPISEEECEWAMLHCGRVADSGDSITLHVSPARTWTDEEFVEIVLRRVGPKLFFVLETIFSLLGLDYDSETVEKLRDIDLH